MIRLLPCLLLATAACAPVAPLPGPVTECRADAGQRFVGTPLTGRTTERARRATGAKTVRTIRPGVAVTMDYRVDRLNVEVDDKGDIVAVRCG